MLHNQKTSGIMGIQPLATNMPLRITNTDPSEKETLFKNRRCKLYGWTLHQEDQARLDACSEREMILQHLPEELFLQFEGATWIWSKDLGPGVMGIKPKIVDWYLDQACKVRVRRKGFTVASDFSGTAHSFAGASLPAAFIDCLPWDAKPDKEAQVSAYMCISRVSYIDDICVTQPYAPSMFSMGDLPGPVLLLKFQRGEIQQEEL